MIMPVRTILMFAAFVAGLTFGRPASAQNAVLRDLYGKGVHAFNAGKFDQAYDVLSSAAAAGSKDPRVYYFRAMALMKMGREPEAMADMQQGAALESADANQSYPVGRSLERVQGRDRLALEQYRATARATALARQERRNAARYEQRRRAESEVLRRAATAPPAAPPPASSVPTEVAKQAAGSTDADGQPADNGAANEADPFAADASGDDKATETLNDADSMPAENKAPSDGGSPLKEASPDTNDTGDPFAPPASDKPAAAAPKSDPASKASPAAGSAVSALGGMFKGMLGKAPAAPKAAAPPASAAPKAAEPKSAGAAADSADPFADEPAQPGGPKK